jgi:hypothetical protein
MKTILFKQVLSICLVLLSSVILSQTINETIHLETPGSLNNYSFSNPVANIEELVITGNIDARDFKFMRDDMSVLASLDLSGANIAGYSGEGGTFYGQITYPANEIPTHAFCSYRDFTYYGKRSLTSVKLPSNLISVGERAFCMSGLSEVLSFPESLLSIGNLAFSYCDLLTSAEIPKYVTYISEGAFYGCSSLNHVLFPEDSNLTNIRSFAFYGCNSLASVDFPEGLQYIGEEAFNGCRSLSSIVLPENITSIEKSTFANCDYLTTVSLPENLLSIGNQAFSDCRSLNFIEFPANMRFIGTGAFSDCTSLDSIVFPENSVLDSISTHAFFRCSSLRSAILPKNLSYIGEGIFNSCTALASVELPENLDYIGDYAFEGCYSLRSIVNYNPAPVSVMATTFYGVNKTDCSLMVPVASVSNYRSAMEWKDFNIQGGYRLQLFMDDENAGTVTGGGLIPVMNPEATVEAIPENGRVFYMWTTLTSLGESGEAVSTENPYTFMLSSDTILVANFSVNDVEDIFPENIGFTLYPNPVKNFINLNIENKTGKVFVQIFNSLGVVCYNQELTGGTSYEISLDGFSEGFYFVKVNENIIKIIKLSE